jgi:parvulin-like peptidyl-prolyl isomerase
MRFPLLIALGIAASGCADLTAPSSSGGPAAEPTATAPTVSGTALQARAPSGPTQVHAAHILIAYQGAMRSHATRSKEEAKKLAEQLLTRAKGGADFAQLARDFSDDPSAKSRGGDLGKFTRVQMTKKFSDAAFALGVGQLSDVVETELGFHIIKRLE